MRLAGLIDWAAFERACGPLYHERVGRPGKPIRLMVGLTDLKHTFDLSDEEVCARWVENPYWQLFCGFDLFQHRLPIDPSSLTRWRARLGPAGMEELLKVTVAAALAAGAARPRSLERLSVDTTVQPKAIAHPLDSRRYHRGREILVRLAAKHGLPLRQSYRRLAKRALRLAGRYAHARQRRRARREIKRLKTMLGRVGRDVGRQLAGRPELAPHFARPLALVRRLLAQRRSDTNKLYALHAPEVACIAKARRTGDEFGAKVAVATTNREGFVVGALALAGNPYDGPTLQPALDQAERITGIEVERCYVDRGYRGHNAPARTRVVVAGQRRGVTPTMRRALRRRGALEAMIGQRKADGRLDRNYLKGAVGDAINALLCGAGHNLRLLLNHLGRLRRALLATLLARPQWLAPTVTG